MRRWKCSTSRSFTIYWATKRAVNIGTYLMRFFCYFCYIYSGNWNSCAVVFASNDYVLCRASRSNKTIAAIHRLLWDDKDQFYYYKQHETFVRVPTPSGFAPLLLPGVSDARVEAIIRHINDPKKFASAVPLPTVALDYVTLACPASSTNMWRRPAWTNTNLFTIWGLRRYAHVPGALEAAAKLQEQTVEMVAKNYAQWGTTFEFYDSNGKVAPPYLERKGSRNSGGVRDYHWTAANTFYLLHNPNATLP